MTSEELKDRTKKFSIMVFRLIASLPTGRIPDTIAKQLVRSATSIGANYRSACRGRSRADFISRIQIVEEEADESVYWLELLLEAGIGDKGKIELVHKEAKELTAIFTATGKTAKARK